MSKKGQFFLVAALVIVIVIVGLGTIYVSTQFPEEDAHVYDLSEEINFEASQVIDNGILTANQDEIQAKIENLTDTYSKLNPNSDLFIVYGNQSEVTVLYYNRTKIGNIGITTGGPDLELKNEVLGKFKGQKNSNSANVEIELAENIKQDFKVVEGQNFYIIVKKEYQDERTIATN